MSMFERSGLIYHEGSPLVACRSFREGGVDYRPGDAVPAKGAPELPERARIILFRNGFVKHPAAVSGRGEGPKVTTSRPTKTPPSPRAKAPAKVAF